MKSAEIVTICASGFPGTNRSLRNLEKNTGLTRHYVLTSNDPEGVEVEFFAEQIRGWRPRVVLVGGWCELYASLLRRLARTRIAIGVYWTSSPGQTDISGEAAKLAHVLREPRIRYRLFADAETPRCLSGEENGVLHLPVTMDLEGVAPLERPRGKPAPAVLSLFCSPHEYGRKNVLNTLLALSGLEEDYVLHVNGMTRSAPYRRLLRDLGVPHRDLGWMKESAYRRALEEIDIGLQVSFAETFNFVAAQHLALGIPVVASAQVPVVSDMPAILRRRMIAPSIGSPIAIRDAVRWWIRHPRARASVGRSAAKWIREMNGRRIATARAVLHRLTAARQQAGA